MRKIIMIIITNQLRDYINSTKDGGRSSSRSEESGQN